MGADVRDLLRQLATIDLRASVWCACACVRTAIHLAEVGDRRPLFALEAAEAWTRGEATLQACARAADEAEAAAEAASGRSSVAYYVANAANAAANAAWTASNAVTAAQDAARAVALAASGDDRGEGADPFERHLAALSGLVSAERWPLTWPSADQIRAARPGIQVAWDWLSAAAGPGRAAPTADLPVVDLIEARMRAHRFGFDWADPVQRAVAERASDEERVMDLLAGRAAGPRV